VFCKSELFVAAEREEQLTVASLSAWVLVVEQHSLNAMLMGMEVEFLLLDVKSWRRKSKIECRRLCAMESDRKHESKMTETFV